MFTKNNKINLDAAFVVVINDHYFVDAAFVLVINYCYYLY